MVDWGGGTSDGIGVMSEKSQFKGNMSLKDDFQSVLRSLRTLMVINIITAHSMEWESMLFVKNHVPYL